MISDVRSGILPFVRPITNAGIVLENAEDPGMSDFMVLDVSVVAGGKVVDGMEFYGRFGKVVDLKYKIGYQWDTY